MLAARDAAPEEIQTQRSLALALTRQGRFEEATGPWFAVLALAPGDAEALQAIDDLRPMIPRGCQAVSTHGDVQRLLAHARENQAAGHFDAAEELYSRAQAALGGDLAVLEEREELRLARSEQRLAIARLRATHDAHRKAAALVARMQDEQLRVEIEMLHLRAERRPEDAAVRLALARRLKEAGNYSGAIQRLEEARQLTPEAAAVFIELGESWQHLRQFDRALAYYRQAMAAAVGSGAEDEETLLLARYRLAVLAAAMGESETARAALIAIVEASPRYRDAERRLRMMAGWEPE